MEAKSKKMVMSGIAASITSVALYCLKDQSNRTKFQESLRELPTKVKNTVQFRKKPKRNSVNKGGQPYSRNLEDNKMVSEGAQYSVQYYDQKK